MSKLVTVTFTSGRVRQFGPQFTGWENRADPRITWLKRADGSLGAQVADYEVIEYADPLPYDTQAILTSLKTLQEGLA